jgi:hypothetical protein
MIEQVPAIFAFSSLFLAMIAFITYIGVMWLMAMIVAWPLSYFLGSIFNLLRGRKSDIL